MPLHPSRLSEHRWSNVCFTPIPHQFRTPARSTSAYNTDDHGNITMDLIMIWSELRTIITAPRHLGFSDCSSPSPKSWVPAFVLDIWRLNAPFELHHTVDESIEQFQLLLLDPRKVKSIHPLSAAGNIATMASLFTIETISTWRHMLSLDVIDSMVSSEMMVMVVGTPINKMKNAVSQGKSSSARSAQTVVSMNAKKLGSFHDSFRLIVEISFADWLFRRFMPRMPIPRPGMNASARGLQKDVRVWLRQPETPDEKIERAW